jgi:hypothetical protein
MSVTFTETFTVAEILQLKTQAERVQDDMDLENPVVHYIAGEALMAGFVRIVDSSTLGASTIMGIALGAINEMSASVRQDTADFYNAVYVAMNQSNADLVKIETKYSEMDVPAQRGWEGGDMLVQYQEPTEVAYHIGNGWQYV